MAGNRIITKNLIDNNTDLLYKGKPVSLTADLGRTLWVTPNGDNAIALIGRIDRPFRTIQAALDACPNGSGTPHHIMVLAGNYLEHVTNIRTGMYVTIELMPGVLWYGASSWCFSNTQSDNIIIKGNRQTSKIYRANSGTDGAVQTHGNLYDLNIETPVGAAVKASTTGVSLTNCKLKSTGGIGFHVYYGGVVKNSQIESTVSYGMYSDGNVAATLLESTVLGQTDGIRVNNGCGLKARNSYINGNTGYGFYGSNWHVEGTLIENTIIRGYTKAMLTWDNGVYADRVKFVSNSTLLVMDAAQTLVSEINVPARWFLQNVRLNKPFHLQDQLAQANNINLLDSIPFVPALHAWIEN